MADREFRDLPGDPTPDGGVLIPHQVATGGPGSTRTSTLMALVASVPPKSHNHNLSQVTDAGTAAAKNVPAVGNATVSQVVLGSDTRLTDARTPTAHGHVLADISNAGTAAAKNVPAGGDAAAGEVVQGNDSRLINKRQPANNADLNGHREALDVQTGVTGATALDLDGQNTFDLTIVGNTTITFSNIPAGKRIQATLIVRQGAGAPNTLAITGAKWDQNTPPTLSIGVGDIDIIDVMIIDGEIFAFFAGEAMA